MILLLTALAGAGCGIDLSGLQGSPICTLDCGERPPSGVIRSSPPLASLAAGETIRVTATLTGPIVIDPLYGRTDIVVTAP